ncbi:hypothetical protein L207DRAFT_415408 [Hyaloscypha variabilis F]|uniref:Zn(2)-C6 fungal-type domain-containing protein n=1 Tax=Hyaloscypha variabilis (strain UAMH 11265 / GT02V1 / F) TaxID=1149755 RepID=A0A2J6S8I1_HYAVF|nr:hypothetical protein L207DRAFT_415408 [Hyaloscypha variabilis F]
MSTTSSVQKTRRSHTKSRGGCRECKRRKLKCGEQKPACSGCVKREIQCEYLNVEPPPSTKADVSTTAGTLNPTQAASSIGSSTPSSIPIRDLVDPRLEETVTENERRVGHFDMEDINLWHHFIQSTAQTLAAPWKEYLVERAISCDYLVHGMLATAALHLGYLSSDPKEKDRYAYLASQHHDVALGPFQRAMTNITAANANQLWVFSTLLMTFTYASFRSREHLFPFAETASDEVLSNWMLCIRGCVGFVQTALAHLEGGPLGQMISEGLKVESSLADGALPDPEVDQSLSLLTTSVFQMPIIKSTTTVEEMEAYADAIERLRNMFAAYARGLNSSMTRASAAMWVGRVSSTFIRLLSEKRPPALILTAHYCLLLKYCEDIWYMEQRSYFLFEAVKQNLGEEWAPYVEYPHRILYSRP